MIEVGVIAGYVIAWALRKARRAAGQADAAVDVAIDAGLAKLGEVVTTKLGVHPVLADLAEEAAAGSEDAVSDLTRQQIELAVAAAAGKDETFGQEVTELLTQLRTAEQAAGQSLIGNHGVNIAGNVTMHAERGAAAALRMGTVNIGQPPTGRPDSPVPTPSDPH